MMRISCVLVVILLAGAGPAVGRDIHVNNRTGDDAASGDAATPLATAQRAVNVAAAGDTIHLLPEGALYRQAIHIREKDDITIDGHGVTLSGADPVPADGWEEVGPKLFRRKMPCHLLGRQARHLLIVDGRCERMGRSPSVRSDFPPPEKLQPGQFSWRMIDERFGWLYVRGTVDRLEWSVRMAGLATSGRSRNVTVRNLNTRHALNDGFNIHGDARGMRFFNVTGYENFDEGFSAHDTCQCWIEDGRFWGNDHAAYDVNDADTYYRRCEFRDSLTVELGFQGGRHRLEDCRILGDDWAVLQLTVATLSKAPDAKPAVSCELCRVQISASGQKPSPVLLGKGAVAQFVDCTLTGVSVSAAGAKLTATNSTLDGRPWKGD